LFFAAQGGYLDIIKILLKNGALVDCPSVDGGTPLFVACQGGHANIVKELLNAGATVNAYMKVLESERASFMAMRDICTYFAGPSNAALYSRSKWPSNSIANAPLRRR
jgi:ankyrin repeat protein